MKQVAVVLLVPALLAAAVTIESATPGSVIIRNRHLAVRYDLERGTWASEGIRDARTVLDRYDSTTAGATRVWRAEYQALLVTTTLPGGGPRLLLRIRLDEDARFLDLAAGLENVQLKYISPLSGATALAASNPSRDRQGAIF